MGIQDRDYYRKSGPGFLGSFSDRGIVCKWLVGINVAVFVLQLMTYQPPRGPFGRESLGPVTEGLVLDTSRVLQGEVWRLLTYGFLHSPTSFFHILFNMLVLWWFGQLVEEIYGAAEFLAFYLTAIVIAGLAFMGATQLHLSSGVCLGASGGVMAVVLLFACHYPTKTVYFMMVLPMSVWVVVCLMIVLDLFGLISPNGVAVSAHLGGAAFGFLYYKLHWRLTRLLPKFPARRRQARPPLRIYREDEPLSPVGVPATPAPEDEQLEARLDAILEKISRSGKESLTDSERQLLLRASEALRRRRT